MTLGIAGGAFLSVVAVAAAGKMTLGGNGVAVVDLVDLSVGDASMAAPASGVVETLERGGGAMAAFGIGAIAMAGGTTGRVAAGGMAFDAVSLAVVAASSTEGCGISSSGRGSSDWARTTGPADRLGPTGIVSKYSDVHDNF